MRIRGGNTRTPPYTRANWGLGEVSKGSFWRTFEHKHDFYGASRGDVWISGTGGALWVGRIGGWKTPVHQLSSTLFSWFAFVSRTFTQEGVCSVVA
ncbi:hypothetical protein QG37_00867 [Candidozyma auris]|nr:hypothetical protein QG37_00867 [[Candida] auris]